MPESSDPFEIESFFDETTMSVHLKTDTLPKAKRGALDDLAYGPIDPDADPTTATQMKSWADDIEQVAQESPDGFRELDETGMTIIQLREYRIAIARPPFADALEITAVRPIAKTTLDDYDVPEGLLNRFTQRKRGVLIAGSPGAGKSTFAQAVGEFLDEQGVVVKTMEQPRDLQVGPDITQYTALGGDMAKTADSLLLVRPDYTIYDEVRKTSDFDVFADMRLAGVGMLGVVHATRAIDALQRLVGRVELGLIPQIVDTVVYIEAGEIHTVYDITTEVKMPDGMQSEDLARPVIQVRDFQTGEATFEVYTFNRQVVTVEVDESAPSGATTPAQSTDDADLADGIHDAISSVADGEVSVVDEGGRTVTAYVTKGDISRVIGDGGSQVEAIENRFNASIDVRLHRENPR
jgi:ATPase